MKFNSILYVFFIFVLAQTSWFSQAHNHSHQISNPQLAIDLFDKASRLSPEIMNEITNSPATPYIKVGNQNIYLNSHFWRLVAAWLRIYKQELSKECDCQFTAQEIIEAAKDYQAGGIISKALSKRTVSLSGQGVYLTAKYGYLVTTLKVAAEVAETLLSVFVGGKGLHILCNAIDVLIISSAKIAQSTFFKYRYSKNLSHSKLFLTLKNSWISFRISKARKRVFFEINNLAHLETEKVQTIDSLGIKKERRTRWIKKIDHLLEEKLNSDENKYLSSKRARQLEKATKVDYKKFFGKRYKRFLFLFSRKYSSEYMYSKEDNFNKIFKNTKGFPLLIQEGILNAAFEVPSNSKQLNQSYKTDEIKEGLIDEFIKSKNLNTQDSKHLKNSLRVVLQDIDKIFDTSISSLDRHITVATMEIYLNLFLDYYLMLATDSLQKRDNEARIKHKIKAYYLKGQFSREASKYIDFLSIVSSSKNTQKISFYKYESMEAFLLFISYFDKLKDISKEINSFTIEDFNKEFDTYLKKIKVLSLGREKSTHLSLIPFRTPIPKCYTLVKKR